MIDRTALRIYADALPSGFPLILPKELVLALIDGASQEASVPPSDDVGAVNDRMLTAKEAAGRLGMSREWIYKHAHRLPFALRVGRRAIRFSERGITRWQERRRP
jgi:predicted DNA-binding transcriptional regulator AlpA